MLTAKDKAKIIEEFARTPNDTGSPEVQIALLTHRILALTEHLNIHKHDEHCRHGLLNMVGRRSRHKAYLKEISPERYREVIERLGLRK